MPKRVLAIWVALGVVVLTGVFVILFGSHRSGAAVATPTTVKFSASSTTFTTTTLPDFSPTQAVSLGLPIGQWTLPNGAPWIGNLDNGYPDTPLGAIAMAANEVEAQATVDPSIFVGVLKDASVSVPQGILSDPQNYTGRIRTALGIPSNATDVTIELAVDGCYIASATSQTVVGGVEGVLLNEDTASGSPAQLSVATPVTVRWTSSGWKLVITTNSLIPSYSVPGSAGNSVNGWHACMSESS